MMSKTIKFMFVLFLFWESYANAQYIIAGQHSVNDYYHKFTPDSNVIYIPGNNYRVGYYSFDINNDGVMDFQFALLPPASALGFQWYYCTISGLNNNKVALGKYDSCFNYGNGYVSRYGMANAFRLNDTINSKANWNTSVYLSYVDELGAPPDSQEYACGSPDWPDTAYLGVRVQASASYKYGWIKIVGTSFILWVSTTLTMGTFACENGGVDIEQLSSKSEQVTIYPNPARNRLQVTSGSNKIILISIYNMQGLEMISTTEKEIDVSNLQEGVYFARVKTNEGMLAKKIIIQ